MAHGYVTFGSFNALAKITDEVIEVRCCLHARESQPLCPCLDSEKPSACEAGVNEQFRNKVT
jgi:hypothetical protein